ncbi:Uncharacterised protein [Candidatus Gugararchaeum adminiculabundum]|nr:Uncharacterised protein [Candidatus Gugararchaeum adminiculabundum]
MNIVDELQQFYYDCIRMSPRKGNPLEKKMCEVLFGKQDADGITVVAVQKKGGFEYEMVKMERVNGKLTTPEKELDGLLAKSAGKIYYLEISKKKNIKNLPFHLDEKLEGGEFNIKTGRIKIRGKYTKDDLEKLALDMFRSQLVSKAVLQHFCSFSKHVREIADHRGVFITVPIVDEVGAYLGCFWSSMEFGKDEKREIRVYDLEKGGLVPLSHGIKDLGEKAKIVGDEARVFYISEQLASQAKGLLPLTVRHESVKATMVVNLKTGERSRLMPCKFH